MCQLGATPADLAKEFEVDEDTINRWLVRHKDFADACRLAWNMPSNAWSVRCTSEQSGTNTCPRRSSATRASSWSSNNRVHVPADVQAAQFLLMNRRPDLWQLPSKIEPPAPGPAPSRESILRELAQQLIGTGLKPKENPSTTERPTFGEVGEGRDDEFSE